MKEEEVRSRHRALLLQLREKTLKVYSPCHYRQLLYMFGLFIYWVGFAFHTLSSYSIFMYY